MSVSFFNREFLTEEADFNERLKHIKAFIFDWDGVFNDGYKTSDSGSPFSEPDSMGLNMLRFSYWLIHHQMAPVSIISGANNVTATEFAQREHLDHVFLNSKNKIESLRTFCDHFKLNESEVLFVFDDILDLKLAQACGVSICVRRNASPLFLNWLRNNTGCDYITESEGGSWAVREVCELIIAQFGNYDQCVDERINFSQRYSDYLAQRNEIETVIYK